MSRSPERIAALPALPRRDEQAHKGHFGRVLVVGGSRGMAGAVGLAGMAALRGGAGLVQVATPASTLDVVASFEPSYMTAPLVEDQEGRIALAALERIRELAANADVVAIGPGLGRAAALDELVRELYATLDRPLVVDADGLNALAAQPDRLLRTGGPRILTPHPGEFARLVGGALGSREEACQQADGLAAHIRGVVVLKGAGTYVTDGRRAAVNETGNPGMATGGAGDVLTGLIASLACQGLDAWEAARLGVHLHGLAGDLAASELGQVSLIASDLLRFLPAAFRRLGVA